MQAFGRREKTNPRTIPPAPRLDWPPRALSGHHGGVKMANDAGTSTHE
jgi:hypothetical protein